MESDSTLLEKFAGNSDEAAFARLVKRHAPMMLGVALRCTGDQSQAEEVTQTVFAILVRKALALRHQSVAGWLHRSTFLEARNAARKAARYHEALHRFKVSPMNTPAHDSDDGLLSHLDDAMARLPTSERELVLLRFFECQTVRDIAGATQTTEEACKKRLQRAINRLASLLQKRGVSTSAAGLAASLSAQSLCVTPASAATLTTAALQTAPTIPAISLLTHTLQLMNTGTIIKTAAVVAVLAAIPITVLLNQNSDLSEQVKRLQNEGSWLNAGLPTKEKAGLVMKDHRSPAATPPNTGPGGAPTVTAVAEAPSRSDPAAKPSDPDAVGPAATNAKAAAEQLSRVLRISDPFKRSQAFLDLLAQMNPGNGQVYLDGWIQFLSSSHSPDAQSVLFNRRIGQVLGPVVVGQRTGDPKRDMPGVRGYLRDQFLGWMETDATAARGWLDGLKNEKFREAMIGSYLDAVAHENPAAAVAMIRTMPDDLQKQYARQAVATMRETKPPEEVSGWIAGLAAEGNDSRNALRGAYDGLMGSFNAKSGEVPARIFEQHSGQPYADSVWGARIAGHYATNDPANGLGWALHMAERPEFSSDPNLKILNAAGDGVPVEKLAMAVAYCESVAASPGRDMLLARIAARLSASAGAVPPVPK